MCGITGFYSKTGEGLSNHNLVNSANSFQHRGPDSEGYYIKTQNGDEKISNSYKDIQNTEALKVGIGFKRLSILDVWIFGFLDFNQCVLYIKGFLEFWSLDCWGITKPNF